MRTRARSHSGLRAVIDSPSVTPAAASRPVEAHRRVARAGAPAERRQVGRGVWRQDHVLALDAAGRPSARRPGRRRRRPPPPWSTVDALGRQRGDRPVADAARDDVAEHGEVGVDVEGEAVHRPAPA